MNAITLVHAAPDGPWEPSALQVVRYMMDPVGHLERCRDTYGPVFTLRWPGMPPMVYFTEPDAIRELFAAPAETLRAGRSNAVLDFIAGPRSVARLDGEAHKQRRRALSSPFTRLGPDYAAAMVRQTVDSLSASGPVSLQAVDQSLSLRNLIRCALGVQHPATADALHAGMLTFIHDSLNPVMAAAWMALPGVALRKAMVRRLGPLAAVPLLRQLPFVRLSHTIATLDHQLLTLIRAARTAETADILGLLVQRAPEMSDEDLRDELMGLLVAGHETTATTMDWFWVEVLQRPELLARLVAEVDDVLGSDEVTPAHLPRLRLLTATVQECLRLRAPVPSVGRYVMHDTVIAGVPLRRGEIASPCLALAQRDPAAWPDPQTFRPERFLDLTPDRGAHAPFGGGARTCVGRHFALFQLQVVLATALSRFTLTPAAWPAARQVQRGLFTGVSHPVTVTIGARR
jgi:cytochrome P450